MNALVTNLDKYGAEVPWLLDLIEDQARHAVFDSDIEFDESLALETVGYLGILYYINTMMLRQSNNN
tara:strand:+ start:2393 stop:2593 length:201 start_codon:yes stop_codon:yes gene_type:complete